MSKKVLAFTLKLLCLCLPCLLHTSTLHVPPSLPVLPSPPSRPPSYISLVVLPCDRGEGSPGGAVLGGHGVLLRQALLHLLLPDQDTQVDVLRRRPRQRGETGFFWSLHAAAWGGRTVQHLLHLQLWMGAQDWQKLCWEVVWVLASQVFLFQ